jgi:DNA mismatch repair ATPase MutS
VLPCAIQMATMLGGATPRTLCLIDEFGKGTNAQD